MKYRYPCLLLALVSFLFDGCMTAFNWPKGYYGLPMAKTGCPVGATFDWKTGWIFQDTENTKPSNSKSASFHIEGQVLPSSVNRSFCMKTVVSDDSRRPSWPQGTYCIYKRDPRCPRGFNSGSIAWDDENDNNQNRKEGSLPKCDVHSWDGTMIYFCCRKDGIKRIPIDLPVASPFYLFAHTSVECQQVRWAVATSEWIVYDTEDNNNYYDSVTSSAPYVTSGGKIGHKIHFCYYTNCQYILDTSTGSFQSPRYPGNYPNGQQCSWHISVKASQAIFVHFVNFSLNDVNDQLIFYNGTSDSDRRVVTLHGGNTPSDLFSTSSDLFVVFISNEIGNSTGFKVTYKAINTSTVSTISTSTIAKTKTTTKRVPKTPKPSDRPDITPSQHVPITTTPTEEPPLPNRNSSKSYDLLNKPCIQESQASLIAVAIVIPLICVIAVIVMAAYLVFRLRKIHEKPSDMSIRYSPESVNNPSCVRGDVVLEARSPSQSNEYKDSKGDLYHEIEASRQTTDNPLYQSADTEDKHVYASFA